MQPLLTIDHLTVSVQERLLIRDLSFPIYSGAITCVTGDNGVGKTTLMRTLMAQWQHQHQQLTLPQHAPRVSDYFWQVVPQIRAIDADYPLNVANFVQLSRCRGTHFWQSGWRRDLAAVLAATQLTAFRKRSLGALSGGEKQRAYLAQALFAQPQLLILDETTANLDDVTKHQLLKLIREIARTQQIAVLFITHDADLVSDYGDYRLHIAEQAAVFEPIVQKECPYV